MLWFGLASAYVCGLMARNGEHNGQTLGKQAAGIRVVRDDGRPITLATAFVRDVLLKFVVGNVTFGIGWIVDSLWPLGEKENRALHDLAVGHPRRQHARRAAPAGPGRAPQQPVAQQPALAPPIARHVDAARRIQAGHRRRRPARRSCPTPRSRARSTR